MTAPEDKGAHYIRKGKYAGRDETRFFHSPPPTPMLLLLLHSSIRSSWAPLPPPPSRFAFSRRPAAVADASMRGVSLPVFRVVPDPPSCRVYRPARYLWWASLISRVAYLLNTWAFWRCFLCASLSLSLLQSSWSKFSGRRDERAGKQPTQPHSRIHLVFSDM